VIWRLFFAPERMLQRTSMIREIPFLYSREGQKGALAHIRRVGGAIALLIDDPASGMAFRSFSARFTFPLATTLVAISSTRSG
jgi:hypothetical protein